MEWYYASEGASIGPIPEEEFLRLVADGTITRDVLVWHEGMSDWKRYESLAAPEEPEAEEIALGVTRDRRCSECGRTFPSSEMVEYQGSWICASCKPLYFQRLREGVTASGAFDYGGFWIRFAAKIIDSVIQTIVTLLINLVVLGSALGVTFATSPNGEMSPTQGAGFMAANLLASIFNILFALGYTTFFVGRFGATPGKMAFGLKVIRPDGGRVTYPRALGRALGEYLSMWTCSIGYIIAAFDEEKRTLHDYIASTRVIRKQ